MKLFEFKEKLADLKQLQFRLCDGSVVPEHFHITEVGMMSKIFVDCGGTKRIDNFATFQLWVDFDFDHRLVPEKLLSIIDNFENSMRADGYVLRNDDVEVEYQSGTIGRYALGVDGDVFVLANKRTDCLAKDKCGIEVLENECCAPGDC